MNHTTTQVDPIAAFLGQKLGAALLIGALHAVALLWPYILFVAAFSLLRMAPGIVRNRRLAGAGLPHVDRMSADAFEHFLAGQFRRDGYVVETTPKTGDFAGDLILRKDGVRTAVRAKRWSKKPVGVDAVHDAVAARSHFECVKAMVVTNGRFSKQARVLARANDVELRDRDSLAQMIFDAKRQAADPLPPVAPTLPARQTDDDEPQGHVCAACARPVSDAVAAYCGEHPERFGGRVYCFHHQKAPMAPVRLPVARWHS
jgi:restriction system protein